VRYSSEHRSAARRRLLESGGRHAKKHGYAAAGMDALAASAGVTTGSLYRHFQGKSDLFAAIVEHELARSAALYQPPEPDGPAAVGRAIKSYLSVAHVEHPERGCVLPSLTAEVARADETVRTAFESGVSDIHGRMAKAVGSAGKAWAILAQLVGGVMLARAMVDPDARQGMLRSVERNCLSILNGG
jgi:AcrR family transcriptional regulator